MAEPIDLVQLEKYVAATEDDARREVFLDVIRRCIATERALALMEERNGLQAHHIAGLEKGAVQSGAVHGQILSAGTLQLGETISSPIDHPAVAAMLSVLTKRNAMEMELRAAHDRIDWLRARLNEIRSASWEDSPKGAEASACSWALLALIEDDDEPLPVVLDPGQVRPLRSRGDKST
jgi:hypothetical protein